MHALYLLKGKMDFNQTCTDISSENAKNGYILVTLTLFSRSQEVKNVETALSSLYLLVVSLSPEWMGMDFNQTCTDKLLGDRKELVRFW